MGKDILMTPILHGTKLSEASVLGALTWLIMPYIRYIVSFPSYNPSQLHFTSLHQSQLQMSSCHANRANRFTIRFSTRSLYQCSVHQRAWFDQKCPVSAPHKMTNCLQTFPVFKRVKIKWFPQIARNFEVVFEPLFVFVNWKLLKQVIMRGRRGLFYYDWRPPIAGTPSMGHRGYIDLSFLILNSITKTTFAPMISLFCETVPSDPSSFLYVSVCHSVHPSIRPPSVLPSVISVFKIFENACSRLQRVQE